MFLPFSSFLVPNRNIYINPLNIQRLISLWRFNGCIKVYQNRYIIDSLCQKGKIYIPHTLLGMQEKDTETVRRALEIFVPLLRNYITHSASDYILYMLDHHTIENFVFKIIIIRRNFFPTPLMHLQDFIIIKLHFYSQWCSLGF